MSELLEHIDVDVTFDPADMLMFEPAPEIIMETLKSEPLVVRDLANPNDTTEAKTAEANLASESAAHKKMRAKLLGGSLLVASFTGLFVEQTPINEWLRGSQAIEEVKEGSPPAEVGEKIFIITTAIEFGASAFIVAGLNQEGGIMAEGIERSKAKKQRRQAARTERKAAKRLQKELLAHETTPESSEPTDTEETAALYEELGLDTMQETPVIKAAPRKSLTDKAYSGLKYTGKPLASGAKYVATSIGVGAGIIVLDKHLAAERTSLTKDLAHMVGATAIVASFSGSVAFLAAGGVEALDGTMAEGPAETFVDLASSPIFWGIALGPFMVKRFGNWVSDIHRERHEEENQARAAEAARKAELTQKPLSKPAVTALAGLFAADYAKRVATKFFY